MTEASATRRVTRRRGESTESVDDSVVVEEPLEIRIGATPIAVVMRTPGHDEDLVRGFALTEGIALAPQEISAVVDLGEGRRELQMVEGITVDPERFRRNLYATSSCGVCGKASIDAVRIAARTVPPGPTVDEHTLTEMALTLREHQPTFDVTGGLHGAAAFDVDGTVRAVREDVGRHNAVDKVVGTIAADAWPVSQAVLFVSGRVSFEIVQKAAVAGFRIVAGVSAVSSLAIDLATELGITLVGFVRGDGFNVYAEHERIDA